MNTEKCRYSTSDKVKVFAESASAMDDRGERFKLGEAAKNRREREREVRFYGDTQCSGERRESKASKRFNQRLDFSFFGHTV